MHFVIFLLDFVSQVVYYNYRTYADCDTKISSHYNYNIFQKTFILHFRGGAEHENRSDYKESSFTVITGI